VLNRGKFQIGGRNLLVAFIVFGLFAFAVTYIVLNFQWVAIIDIVKRANISQLIIGGSLTTLCFWFFRTLR